MVQGMASGHLEVARSPGEIVRIRRSVDPPTLLCCALSTIALAYWYWSIKGSLTLPGLVFLCLLPPTLFLLGRGLPGLIRFPTHPLRPFPIGFLVGSLAARAFGFSHPLFRRAGIASLIGTGLLVDCYLRWLGSLSS